MIKIKRIVGLMIVMSFMLMLTASLAIAAPQNFGGRGSGGWGLGSPYQEVYKPGSLETISGEVVGIEEIVPMKKMNQGIALVIKTKEETITVHVGPIWYLEYLDVKVSEGDRLEITGFRTDFFGKPLIMAAKITRGDKSLTLRDDAGIPIWGGWNPIWSREGSKK